MKKYIVFIILLALNTVQAMNRLFNAPVNQSQDHSLEMMLKQAKKAQIAWNANVQTFDDRIEIADLTKVNLSGLKLPDLKNLPSYVAVICYKLRAIGKGCAIKAIKGNTEIDERLTIKDLNLSNNELEAIPDELGNISSLRTLNLESNKLEVLPASIGRLSNLQLLNVQGNQLKMLPETTELLKELKVLRIMNNFNLKISREVSSGLQKLPLTTESKREIEQYIEKNG